MIHAMYDRDGKMHTLSVNGHAGYAKRGEDIVCAGVSAIVYSLIAWLENNSESEEYVSIDEHNGEVVIACEGDEKVASVFYMAAVGIETISNTYPDHVNINIGYSRLTRGKSANKERSIEICETQKSSR